MADDDHIDIPGSGRYGRQELSDAYDRMPEAIDYYSNRSRELRQRPAIQDPEVLSPEDMEWEADLAYPGEQLRMIGDESSPGERRTASFHDVLNRAQVDPDSSTLERFTTELSNEFVIPGALGVPSRRYTHGEHGPLDDFEAADPNTVEGGKRTERQRNRTHLANMVSDTARGQTKRDLATYLGEYTDVEPLHLAGVAKIQFGDGMGRTAGDGGAERSGGHYMHRPSRYGDASEIWVRDPHDSDRGKGTLVHEIGHNVSSQGGGYSKRQETLAPGPVTDHQRPSEEAFADDYARNMAPHDQGYTYWDASRDNPEVKQFADLYRSARMPGSSLSPNYPEERAPGHLLNSRQRFPELDGL